MNNFGFIFQGEVEHLHKCDDVKRKIAQLFSVDPSELDNVFNGEKLFIREGLNRFTAESYRKLFKQAGAVSEIFEGAIPLSRVHDASEQSNKETNNTDSEPTDQHASRQDIDDTISEPIYKFAYSAMKWIYASGMILIITFIADEYLNDISFMGHTGIDIGYTPYIIAHIILIVGCAKLAIVKGYRYYVGGLGLLSFLGLAIVIMLPNADSKNHNLAVKPKLILVFSFIIAVVWLNGFMGRGEAIIQIQHTAENLAEGRERFPSGNIEASESIFLTEEQELYVFMSESLNIISQQIFRPDEISQLGDVIFQQLSEFRIWLDYQRFLHLSKGKKLPQYLTKEHLESVDSRFFAFLFDELVSNDEAQKRLKSSMESWVNGLYFGIDESELGLIRKLQKFLFSVYQKAREKRLESTWDQQSNPTTTNSPHQAPDLTQLTINEMANTSIEIYPTYLVITGDLEPLDNIPLVVGIMLEPYASKSFKYNPINSSQQKHMQFNNKNYTVEFVVISDKFPSKYLVGNFNPLRNYQKFLFENYRH